METYTLRTQNTDSWAMLGIFLVMTILFGALALDTSQSILSRLGAGAVAVVAAYGIFDKARFFRSSLTKEGDHLLFRGHGEVKRVDLSNLRSMHAQWGARGWLRFWRSSDSLLTLTDNDNNSIEIGLTAYNFEDTKRLVKEIQSYAEQSNITLDEYTSRTLNSLSYR